MSANIPNGAIDTPPSSEFKEERDGKPEKKQKQTELNPRNPPAPKNKANNNPEKPTDQKDEKSSGAQLKKKAKAEKAAKRAQAKQEQHVPPQDVLKKSIPDGEKHQVGKVPGPQTVPSSTSKGQHRRTGSASANVQKPLPIRQAQQQAPSHPPEAKDQVKKVGFCSHLYGHARRTTILGAGKDVHPSVLALGLQMSNYVICGSNARCVSTLLIFKKVIDAYSTPAGTSLPRHLTVHLSAQIEYLVSCRPLSISMGNAIRWLKLAISRIDPDMLEVKAKSDLCSAIDNFIRERITVAGQVIAGSASSRIQDGDVILTFAKSSIVERTLAETYRQGKKFSVIVVDSGPLFEGRNLARALADLGLRVQYAPTHTLGHVIRDATKTFLGAHAMMSNGHLYSRIGTSLVAMMAKDARIPVIVLCESVKFTDKAALDSIAINEIAPSEELETMAIGTDTEELQDKWRDQPNFQPLNLMYDVTPAEYIQMVITEYGNLPPSSVPVVHRLSTDT
ncbi:MAG: hypothetical protein Q9219_007341 [cf. Caloplaca sp. 3 TL-2023]